MKYSILILAVLISNIATAKTQQQTLGAEEYKNLKALEAARMDIFSKVKQKKMTGLMALVQTKKVLADTKKYQTRFQQKNQLKGVMQRQYAFCLENYIAMVTAEISLFEGKMTAKQVDTISIGYLNASKDYNTLLNESPQEMAKRLGWTMADLQRQTDQIYQLANSGKLNKPQAIELLGKTIPSRFQEIDQEHVEINASMNNDPTFMAAWHSKEWTQVSKLSAQAAVNLANSLSTGNTALVAQNVELKKQWTSIIDGVRGGPTPGRETASSNKK